MRKKLTVVFNVAVIFIIIFAILFIESIIKNVSEAATINEIPKKEPMPIAQGVFLSTNVWCGDNVVVMNTKSGLKWFDIEKNKAGIIISRRQHTPIDCSPDGEWLIYRADWSSRYDKDNIRLGIKDYWRYNFKSKKKQKFAVAEDTACGGRFSPDGKKVLFCGTKPYSFIKQPEPVWRLVWSKSGGGREGCWLSDSSTIVTSRGYNEFIIEKPDKDEPPRHISIYEGINRLKVDTFDRIYFLMGGWGKYVLYRYNTKDEKAFYEGLLNRDNIVKYSMTRDGSKIAFVRDIDSCIWLYKEGEKDVKCVVSLLSRADALSISPNGKWLLYEKGYNLYLIKIS